MTPRNVFRALAVTEAITWICLLAGMFVKYVVGTTDVGVQVAGPVHGVAFIGYCLVTVVVATDQQWSRGRTLLGLASAVPPLMTVWFDRHVEKRGGLDDHHVDPETRHLEAESVAQGLQGVLGGVVVTASGKREAPTHRAHVYDPAPALAAHAG